MSKHAQERSQERYNIELTFEDEKTILGQINHNQYFPIYENTNAKDRLVCYVRFKHIPLKVVYVINKNNYATAIVTILPLNVEEYNEVMTKFLATQNKKFDTDIDYCIKFLKSNGYVVYKRGIL